VPPEPPSITKAHLATAIQDSVPDLHLPHRDAVDLVEVILGTIVEALEDGEDVLITGFGRWKVREKPERPGRNPKTGETMVVSARKVVTWKPSGVLRERMKETREGYP